MLLPHMLVEQKQRRELLEALWADIRLNPVRACSVSAFIAYTPSGGVRSIRRTSGTP